MKFVQRDAGAAIIGVFACSQPGYAEEGLADNDPAVLAFHAGIEARRAAILPFRVFQSRLTDPEYVSLRQAATTRLAAGNGTLARWLEIAIALGIDLNDPKTIAIKANAVANGLLTQARADVIFAPNNS